MKKITIESWGLQANIARKVKVSRSAISEIFTGKHQPSKALAAKLEAEFLRLEIPLTRWDLMYGRPEGQSLADYLKEKKQKEEAEA